MVGWSTALQTRFFMPRQIRTFSEKGEVSYWCKRMSDMA